MMRQLIRGVCAAALLTACASANDGFGGLSATGLQFDQTGVVQMLSEDLYLGLDEVRVSYVFRHIGDEDLTGEVIFPLPPINLGAINESDFAIERADLDKENIVGFTATVDGAKVPVKVDRIAVKEGPYEENPAPAKAYDSPGEDITALLKGYGVPLSLNFETVAAALGKLPKAAKDDLVARELAFFDEAGAGSPLWSIVERYHWTQTFPTGKDVKIAHTYKSAPPGGIFIWREAKTKGESDEYLSGLIKRYCIDGGTQAAIKKALRPSDDAEATYYNGMAYYLDYVLTTANTWAGPIGTFKLTIDKGNAKNVISLCADGVTKTGPTTFVIEKKDFTPTSDISILVVPDVSTLPQ